MSGIFSNAASGVLRTISVASGEVKPKGITLEVTRVEQPHALFDMVLDQGKFDAAEFGISTTIAHAVTGDTSFVHLPIFPSKMFRHSYIFINPNGPIKEPKDLGGRRIGCPTYPQVAAIWCRGHLMHEYGVDLSDVTWVQGSIDHAGTHGSGLRPICDWRQVTFCFVAMDQIVNQAAKIHDMFGGQAKF